VSSPSPTAADLAGKSSFTAQEASNIARAKWAGARLRAEYLMPWTGVFLRGFNPIQTERINTLAVTEEMYLLYNPFFFARNADRMNLWEFGITFLHESLHIFYKHFPREREYARNVLAKLRPPEVSDGFRWNSAGDCEINSTLVGLVPVNPILAGLTVLAADRLRDDWRYRHKTKAEINEKAKENATAEWEKLPDARKYPVDDWPIGTVSMPGWFLFPDKDLSPPQPWRLTAEDYYPFTTKRGEQKKGKKPPPWRGYKVGDRVVDSTTGEEGVVTGAGPWDPETNEQGDVTFVVTNHFDEESRSVEDAGIVAKLKAAKAAHAAKVAAGEVAAAAEAANPTPPPAPKYALPAELPDPDDDDDLDDDEWADLLTEEEF
jgi:hypothetical protein